MPDDAADGLDEVAEMVLAEWRVSAGTVRFEHRPETLAIESLSRMRRATSATAISRPGGLRPAARGVVPGFLEREHLLDVTSGFSSEAGRRIRHRATEGVTTDLGPRRGDWSP
jgi:hypothetical protein